MRRIDTSGHGVEVVTDSGRISARRAALATNVFPSLLRRNALMTVPVYDYVLMTEPLTDDQLATIGWDDRQGLSDLANQFHYFRQSRDGPHPVRRLRRGLPLRRTRARRVREPPRDVSQKLASHFFTTFPQLEGMRFTHRWAGAIDTSLAVLRVLRHRPRGQGRLRRRLHRARRRGDALRRRGDARPARRRAHRAHRARMVRERPLPFPPEPAAAIGINATRWSLDRADHNRGRRNILLKTLDALGLGFDS